MASAAKQPGLSAPAGSGTKPRTSAPSTRWPPDLTGRCSVAGAWRRPDRRAASRRRTCSVPQPARAGADDWDRHGEPRDLRLARPLRAVRPGVLEAALSGCALVLGDMPTCASSGPMPRCSCRRTTTRPCPRAAAPDRRSRRICAPTFWRARPRARRYCYRTHGRALSRRLCSTAGRARRGPCGPAKHAAVTAAEADAADHAATRCASSCFAHSLVSDWNHGNAHFLRGIVRELQARGHEVRLFEPA